MSELTKEEKHAKLTEAVAELFNTVGPADVFFKEKEGSWFLGKKQLTSQQLLQFAQEAEVIKKMVIWKEVNDCLRYLSNRQMFHKATTIDDLIGGKILIFHQNNLNKILDLAITLGKKVKN